MTEQYLKVSHQGKRKPVLRGGPYWVYTRKEGGKTVGQRLSREEAEQIKKDVEAHEKFVALCKEFEILKMRLGELEGALTKTVIGTRLKQSGMEWSVRGANAIISLRYVFVSGRLEELGVPGCMICPTFMTQALYDRTDLAMRGAVKIDVAELPEP